MQEKLALFKVSGMNRDLSESSFNPEFAFENKNIRFSTLDDNTLMSIVNEKGPLDLNTKFSGVPIGYSVIDDKIVLFTTYTFGLNNISNIYLIDIIDDEVHSKLMYTGDLGFDAEHPIETLAMYENHNAIKVYWVDGINQPRVINIALFYEDEGCFIRGAKTLFDFLATMELREELEIEKDSLASGMFTPGTILYVFTYFNKYGLESNIFRTSSLYYISYKDRGAAPDDIVSNAFNIRLSKLDNNFKYVRVYSIHRTSLDAIPTVRLVVDLEIQNSSELLIIFEELPTGELYVSKENIGSRCFTTELYLNRDIMWLNSLSLIRLNSTFGTDSHGTYRKYSLSMPEANGGNSSFIEFLGLVYYGATTKTLMPWFIKIYDDTITENTYPLPSTYKGVAVGNGGSHQLYKSYINVNNVRNVFYTDDGESGATVDPSMLLYIGGKELIALTLTLKDNTLFLGNIESVGELVDQDIKNNFKDSLNNFHFVNDKPITEELTSGIYPYTNHLNKSLAEISTFKYGETYRIGVLLQRHTGEWTEPIFIGDPTNNCTINNSSSAVPNPNNYLTRGIYTIPNEWMLLLKSKYRRVRPLIVYPTYTDRTVICLGVVNPTVFNVSDRSTNSPYAQSSWFFRPNVPFNISGEIDSTGVNVNKTEGTLLFLLLVTSFKPAILATTITTYVDNTTHLGNNRFSILPKGFLETTNKTAFIGVYEVLDATIEEVVNAISASYGAILGPYRGSYNNSLYKILACSSLALTDIIFKDTTVYTDGTLDITVTCDIWSAIIYSVNNVETSVIDIQGDLLEFRHYKALPKFTSRSCEIQCNMELLMNPYLGGGEEKSDYVLKHSDKFFIDLSILTFHSPDIEFDSNLKALNEDGVLLKVVGYIPITGTVGDLDLETSTPVLNIRSGNNVKSLPQGFYKEGVGEFNISGKGYLGLVTTNAWIDELYSEKGDKGYNEKGYVHGFPVYPWHRSGSLNNLSRDSVDPKANEDDKAKPTNYRSAKLLKKKMSNLRFSFKSVYLPLDKMLTYDISGLQIFNSDNMVNTRLNSPTGEGINYYGNINKVITNMTSWHEWSPDNILIEGFDDSKFNYNGYLLAATTAFNPSRAHDIFKAPLLKLKKVGGKDFTVINQVSDVISIDPISIKYKSTAHGVLSLKADLGNVTNLLILPTIKGWSSINNSNGVPFWDANKINVVLLSISVSPAYGWLWLVDLVRTNVTNRFGGNTPNAIENNNWIVCGDSIDLNESNLVIWSEGDTFFLRYDCLKTYPFTFEDVNSVVDILSFMCETRINLDGRYDKNRGQSSNLVMNPNNFNKLNDVYSLRNNFFNYRILDNDLFNFNKYPYTVAWSKTKNNGEKIDTWTSINMASSIDLDGNLGTVNAVRKFNDNLIVFLTKGISLILFNELTLTATSGVPIEIANSGRVTGKRYISTTVGCYNKWSMCETPNGLYFIDDYGKVIYLFNGLLSPISDANGFHSWMTLNCKESIWNPETFDNVVTYYDLSNQDVLFIAKDWALAFSEGLGRFTSFYDYNNTPYLINFKGNSYWLNTYTEELTEDFDYTPIIANSIIADKNKWLTINNCIKVDNTLLVLPRANQCFNTTELAASELATLLSGVVKFKTSHCTIWKHNAGEYNKFFNEVKPFYTTILVNQDLTYDKVYSTLEFRADNFIEGECQHFTYPFDTLEAWNEHLRGKNIFNKNLATDLRKKFRVWRADIPRNNMSETHKRDRMRNPWLYLKLSKDNPLNEKTILHDLVVHYYV